MKTHATILAVFFFLLPAVGFADTCVYGDTGAITSAPFTVTYPSALSATPTYINVTMKSKATIGGNSRYIDLVGHWTASGQGAHSINCAYASLTCETPTSTTTAAVGFHDSVTGNQRGLFLTTVGASSAVADGDLPGTGLDQGFQYVACVSDSGGGSSVDLTNLWVISGVFVFLISFFGMLYLLKV